MTGRFKRITRGLRGQRGCLCVVQRSTALCCNASPIVFRAELFCSSASRTGRPCQNDVLPAWQMVEYVVFIVLEIPSSSPPIVEYEYEFPSLAGFDRVTRAPSHCDLYVKDPSTLTRLPVVRTRYFRDTFVSANSLESGRSTAVESIGRQAQRTRKPFEP
ncbi:uncharacterized protein HD556DRAFT_53269 [Suillus plorans]|uniref:Uncharacterized protein n=1 Tax=Suillus plorans TaxID=116603 RepID=A0A9P7JA05_9AGAM|nr:uncharacterized protein HD556DRAFT_53269 [Suillus plorans]KAG1810438.1 hypothetical protein HD556DRAFT_53269 [Suillus plorans]